MQRPEIELPIAAIGERSEVSARVFLDAKPMVTATETGLEIAEHALDPLELGQLLRLSPTGDSSPTFGKWEGGILSVENKKQMWIPEGFARGFVVLTDAAGFLGKTTGYRAPQYERSIAWNDASVAIGWPIQGEPGVSGKDAQGATFKASKVFA